MKSLSRVWLFATLWTVAHQGSSVHGILQSRILEWVASSFSRESSRPRDRTQVSRIEGRCFNLWVTREKKIVLLKCCCLGRWSFWSLDLNYPMRKNYVGENIVDTWVYCFKHSFLLYLKLCEHHDLFFFFGGG